MQWRAAWSTFIYDCRMGRSKALPILMYHHVSQQPGLVTVSPETFRDQIGQLARAGWRTVGLDAVEHFFAGAAIPEKTCIITFDDAYADNMVHAAPVLAEGGMKAVVFAVTGWMGDGPPRSGNLETPSHRECKRRIAVGDSDSVIMRWKEAERLQSAGVFEFHSHTHTHARWDKTIVDGEDRRAALRADLGASKSALAKHLGVSSRHLCWPQGHYDDLYLEVAREMGMDYLYTTEPRVNSSGAAPTRIGRFVIKDKPGKWILRRTRLYASPILGRLYTLIRPS
jgi:peptidoglycan/xylan/chitin deacetylase (PgdA/CDA1 family)